MLNCTKVVKCISLVTHMLYYLYSLHNMFMFSDVIKLPLFVLIMQCCFYVCVRIFHFLCFMIFFSVHNHNIVDNVDFLNGCFKTFTTCEIYLCLMYIL